MENFLQSIEAHPGTSLIVAIFALIALGIIADMISDIIRILKR